MDIKQKILVFLHKQVNENKIPHIRKGMVEDFEGFINDVLADLEAHRSAERMASKVEDTPDEQENS